MAEMKKTWIGVPVKSREDLRFVQGKGKFVDDLTLPDMLHAVILGSPYAHARIKRIDLSAALGLDGVIYCLTGDELARAVKPFPTNVDPPYNDLQDYPLAVGKVRYAGEPVVAIVAVDRYTAEDALELVKVDYEPLPPVLDPEKAMQTNSPLLYEHVPSNTVWNRLFDFGDVDKAFQNADAVVKTRLHFQRFTSSPLEPYAVLASYDPSLEVLTIYSNTQQPGRHFPVIARALNFPRERIRVICPDIGGGFGIKNSIFPYLVLISVLSMKTGRPVKWIQDRIGHLQASSHGNEMIDYVEMAVKNDGTILGVKIKMIADEGAKLRIEPRGATNWVRQATTTYKIKNLRCEVNSVLTTKCPVGANRSYGKMQHGFILERLIDKAAKKLEIDPAEIRLRNFVRPEEMPYETPSGGILDGGNYPLCLKKALEVSGYEKWRQEQLRLRKEGKFIGIGIGVGMDACPASKSLYRLWSKTVQSSGDSEAAGIRIGPNADISVAVGSAPQGHSHETTTAQIVATELGVSPEQVFVQPGFDSWTTPFTDHSGTYASRFGIVGHGAVLGAVRKLKEKILRISAHLLEAKADELDLVDGQIVVRGDGRSVTLKDVARTAWDDLGLLPQDTEAGLIASFVYRPPLGLPKTQQTGNFSLTYSYSVAIAVVEVDIETGKVKILKIVNVEDAGRRINPMIVEGQVHGQLGHQIGAALYERLIYDEEGQLLTSTFKDYLAPKAADLPDFETEMIETPSLFSELGTRGMGEGGGSGLLSVVAAASDALTPFGIEIDFTNLHPEEILTRIKANQP